MKREEVLALARKAGFQTGIIYHADGEGSYPVVYPVAESCFVEIERLIGLTGAHEMLEALELCEEAMAYMSEYDIPLTLPDKVSAAIAKAKGEL